MAIQESAFKANVVAVVADEVVSGKPMQMLSHTGVVFTQWALVGIEADMIHFVFGAAFLES